MLAIKKERKKGVYFVKTKLKTYEVNNSVNCIKYEGMCLRGKLPNTAGENNSQMIDRSSLSRRPTQSTTICILKCYLYYFKLNKRAA